MAPQTSSTLVLPTSLVLLLHLHIMMYPRCSSPEYTPGLFASRQPLRSRTTLMEDIVAFLIEKIEGRSNFKSILGSIYPCLQPSDSVGFRAVVAKYIETLRASVIRLAPITAVSNGRAPVNNRGMSTSKITGSQLSRTNLDTRLEHGPHRASWWWTTVVVRKSLLEECTGERFEKMLLALSTHALSVQIPPSSPLHPSSPSVIPSDELQRQPQEYANLLACAFDLYTKRLQKAARLTARTQDLLSLRAPLKLGPNGATESQDTKRILAARDSKWNGLVGAWDTTLNSEDQSYVDGETAVTAGVALKWFMSMAGVFGPTISREKAPPAKTPQSDVNSINATSAFTIQTLPTASAHHPLNIHKLNLLPGFAPIGPEDYLANPETNTFTSPALEELMSEATSQRASLKAALEAATREGDELRVKLDVALKRGASTRKDHAQENSLDLWEGGPTSGLDFEAPLMHVQEACNFLETLNVAPLWRDRSESERQNILENRVLAVRDMLHPSIPPPGAPFLDVPPIENPSSEPERQHPRKLSREEALAQTSCVPTLSSPVKPVRTPRTPRPYQTSTPPTKSRSMSVRKAVKTFLPTEIDSSPFAKLKLGSLERQDEKQVDEVSSSEDGWSILARSQGSVPLPVIRTAPCPEEMIADMSLPEFSEGSLASNNTLLSVDGTINENWINYTPEDGEKEEVPYEGHSVTLRDILIKAGGGEDMVHLIEDVRLESIGDETMGWS